MRKFLVYIGQLVLIVLILYGLARLLAVLPAEKFPLYVSDQVVRLQAWERDVQSWFADFGEALQLVAVGRRKDREYETLYRQKLAENVLVNALTYENTRLAAALQFQRNYGRAVIPAEIVGRSGDQWFSFVTVAKGTADGLRADMVAVDAAGLVGSVYTVGQNSAKVRLLTDPLSSVSVVNERNGEMYVLTGKGLNRLDLKYATLHSDIRIGDKLLTSGYSYRYRKGIPVGVVTAVHLPRNSLSKKVTVKPSADLSGLDIIFFVR